MDKFSLISLSPFRIVVLHWTGNPSPQGPAGSIPAAGVNFLPVPLFHYYRKNIQE